VDGAVLKLDEVQLHGVLGVADTDPRWAVAWKFPAEMATTVLQDILFTVGRTGQVGGGWMGVLRRLRGVQVYGL
jgi:DNA ligase (NAD+)